MLSLRYVYIKIIEPFKDVYTNRKINGRRPNDEGLRRSDVSFLCSVLVVVSPGAFNEHVRDERAWLSQAVRQVRVERLWKRVWRACEV